MAAEYCASATHSFVTAKTAPADFDGCWETEGVSFGRLDLVMLDFSNQRWRQKAKFGGELFIANDVAEPTGTKFIDSQPGWSPSGRRLTFVRQTAHPSRNGLQALFVVNRDGSHARRLSPWALRAGHHPDWSPLGGRIVFTSNADGADPNRPSNIYSIRPNGKGLRQLTHASAGQLYLSSSYSPDGHWLTFAMEPSPNANAQVFVMRSNGTGLHTVTGPDAWSSAPDWSFRG